MADAAELIKHTGRFYDRYAETHKASIAEGTDPRNGSGKSLGTLGGGYCQNCRAAGTSSATAAEGHPGAGPSVSAPSLRGQQQESSRSFLSSLGAGGVKGVATGIGGRCYFPETSGSAPAAAAGSPQCWGGGGGESSGNFLERYRTCETRTVGRRTGGGGAAAAGGEVDLRELDQRCYSLLESNARLCLRLQGLGLEYAGLARELLAAGEVRVCVRERER